MIKKVIVTIIALTTILLMVACEEITDEFEKAQRPSIELKSEGELIQIYDENVTLEDVTFTVVFKQFAENNINIDQVEIQWYVRDQLMSDRLNEKTYLQIVNAPGEITIRVKVIFNFEGKEQSLEENSLINVIKTPTNIIVSNNIDTTTHRISVVLGAQSEVTFNGRITGNLNHEVIKWVIQLQSTGEPVLVEEIDATLEVLGNEATATLTYRFEAAGDYIVTLQTGEGTGQDANKYISNSTHINVGYGVFELSTEGARIQSQQQKFTNRMIYVSILDETLVGEGSYEWYLNGEKLDHTGHSYEHTNMDFGGYLYEVQFVRTEDDAILKTDPLLIVNGLEVDTEEALLQALENEMKAIILTDDIEYTNESASLDLKYPVTIYGNGHTLSSKEIQVFMSIKSDRVYLSHMTIIRANRYNLMMTQAKGIYLEDIKVDELGGGSDVDAFLSGDFGSGVYINQSEVVIKNIEFLSGGLVGIRIDNDKNDETRIAKLELIGSFIYNREDPLFLPIGSGKSNKNSVEVHASGFDYFALPAGEIVIRRWDNQGDPVVWELYNPEKMTYQVGEHLDLFGIGIFVDISFLNMEISGANGLDFVKMYIALFKQYGKLEITDLNDVVLQEYFIIGEATDTIYGQDKLAYSLDKVLLSNTANPGIQVEPVLPSEPGQYKVKIYIGEEFYLGHIIITIE